MNTYDPYTSSRALDAWRTTTHVSGTGPQTKKDKMATSDKSTMRRFLLERVEDMSGTSGTGIVAEGTEYSNGRVCLHWLSQFEVMSMYDNIRMVERVHGHEGRTNVRWIDEETR